jgi:DNA-binding CsgD family transcriptional regulator
MRVIDLKGEPPTQQMVAELILELKRSSAAMVINAYRVGKAPEPLHLSPKETLVVAGVRRGLTNRAIADEMGTTQQVIKNYLYQLSKKFGVKSRLQLLLHLQSYDEERRRYESDRDLAHTDVSNVPADSGGPGDGLIPSDLDPGL